jgi:hypothetical protein
MVETQAHPLLLLWRWRRGGVAGSRGWLQNLGRVGAGQSLSLSISLSLSLPPSSSSELIPVAAGPSKIRDRNGRKKEQGGAAHRRWPSALTLDSKLGALVRRIQRGEGNRSLVAGRRRGEAQRRHDMEEIPSPCLLSLDPPPTGYGMLAASLPPIQVLPINPYREDLILSEGLAPAYLLPTTPPCHKHALPKVVPF